MPQQVTLSRDERYIHVESWGDVSLDDLVDSMKQLVDLSREKGLKRVFVNATRETSSPSSPEIFQFGKRVAKHLQYVKLAVVISKSLEEDLRFFESVSRNRGADVRIFDSSTDALKWLLD
jgi:hypothetical protein